VIFTGLCTFVHHGKRIDAEMPSIPIKFRSDEGPDIPAHRPFLVVDSSIHDIARSGGVQPDLVVAPYEVYFLEGKELSVWDTTNDVVWNDTVPSPCAAQTASQHVQVSDDVVIPHLSKLCSCNENNPAAIDARVRLTTKSNVQPYVVNDRIYDFTVKTDPNEDVLHERISQLVDWTLPISGELTLFKASLQPQSPLRSEFLTIKVKDGREGEPVVIFVGAADPDELKNVLAGNGGGSHQSKPDHHFEVYYSRCVPPARKKRIPRPPATANSCADARPAFIPNWAWPQPHPPVTPPMGRPAAIVGSVDCGPDQIP
jgi:hypothetical protein